MWPKPASPKLCEPGPSCLLLEPSLLCWHLCCMFLFSNLFSWRVLSCLFALYRFLFVLGRHTYITPTSYLELISSFKTLFSQKQLLTMESKQRYVVGLEKLAFAASAVCAVSHFSALWLFVSGALYEYSYRLIYLLIYRCCVILDVEMQAMGRMINDISVHRPVWVGFSPIQHVIGCQLLA